MRNVALIELTESHGECIYSQALFLHNSVDTLHLIIHEKLEDQTNFDLKIKNRFFISYENKFLERIKTFFCIRKYLLKNDIDTIIFNTATGRLIQELLLFIPKKINCIGSIHDGRKLVKSSTQKSISKKMNGYYILNDYIKDYLISKNVNNIKVQPYYPIFFPPIETDKINKDKNEFWITIPGKVEQKRRNYLSLIESLSKSTLSENIKFVLLGPANHFNGDGKLILEKINENGLSKNFIMFDGFINNSTYFAYIEKSDMIMPLVEPGNEFYETYKYSQITGSYNLAFGYKIPLLYHQDLSHINDLKNFGISYNHSTLIDTLIECINQQDFTKICIKKMNDELKFQKEYQTKIYNNFIFVDTE